MISTSKEKGGPRQGSQCSTVSLDCAWQENKY